jgi:hypothetical protein
MTMKNQDAIVRKSKEDEFFENLEKKEDFNRRFITFTEYAIRNELDEIKDEPLFEFWSHLIFYAKESKALEVKPERKKTGTYIDRVHERFPELDTMEDISNFGSKRYHAKYHDLYEKLDAFIAKKRMHQMMRADTFDGESNNAVQQNFDQQKKFLAKMIEMTGSKHNYAGKIASGEYVAKGWKMEFYVEYWSLPMPSWSNLYPAFTIGVHYTNETGSGWMDQFFVVQPHLSEIFCLINHATNVVFKTEE